MTVHQIESLAIIAGMLALFVSDRLHSDLIAALALSADVLLGVVAANKASARFSSSAIIGGWDCHFPLWSQCSARG